MYQAFLIKYSEIGIKGKNRHYFIGALANRIKKALHRCEGEFLVSKEQGRIYVEAQGGFDYDEAVEALKCVFGIAAICPVVLVEDKEWDELCERVCEFVEEQYPNREFRFKVEAKRSDKAYPLQSPEIGSKMGAVLLSRFPELKVDVKSPDVFIYIEIRGKAYVYSKVIKGLGGMPVGTSGKAMLLLSGGIDSPVAGYMVAKRGVELEAVYFHAPPYTSERAKQKVVDLAKLVSTYAGEVKLHIINFTEIQMYIYDQCPHEELTILMRRYMMRIAEKLALDGGCLGLVTGESIGQVASQTMHGLLATNEVCTLPVYRPLIAFDKQDIVSLAQEVGTFETSILPYEDCCTVFVAKHPVIKPNVKAMRRSEGRLEEKIGEMLERAFDTVETLVVS